MIHHIIIRNSKVSEILSLTEHSNKSYLSSASLMNSEDEHIASDAFDVPNSVDTQIFDQFKPSLSYNNLCDNYLREHIGEPLRNALAYVIIYRPDDPIEFIASK